MKTTVRFIVMFFLLSLGACGKTTGVKVGKKQVSAGGAQKASVAAMDTMKKMADKLEAADLAQKPPNEIAQMLIAVLTESLKNEQVKSDALSIAGRFVGVDIVLQGTSLKLSLSSTSGGQVPWMEASGVVGGTLERVGSLTGHPDQMEVSAQTVRTNEKDAKTQPQRPGKKTQGELYAKCLNECRQVLLFISRGNWVIPLVHAQYTDKNTQKGSRLKIVAGFLEAIKKQGGGGREASLKDPAVFELKMSIVPAGKSRVAFEARPKNSGSPLMVPAVDVSIEHDGPAEMCLGIEAAPDCPAN